MKQKVYPGSLDTEDLAGELQRFSHVDGYQVQKLGTPEDLYVQIRKAGIVRTVVGLDQALTVHLQKNGGSDTIVSLGQAKWADKAVVEAVGFFVFLPLMIPSSYGLYEQSKLPGKILKVIDDYVASKGIIKSREVTLEPVHCPQCGVTNAPGAAFCSACGSKVKS